LFAKDSSAWSVLSQLILRGAASAKFLLLALISGPEGIGRITALLAILAIIEVATDIGITSALIRRSADTTPKVLGAAWVASISRIPIMLIFLSAALYVLNKKIEVSHSAAISLTIVIASRASICPLYNILPRLGQFRTIAGLDAFFASIDIGLLGVFFALGEGAESALVSAAISEALKTSTSWWLYGRGVAPNLELTLIEDIRSFAKWHWGTNIAIAVLNQSDKILIGYLAGSDALGKYQTAIKLAQLAISDYGNAISTNAYPKLASAWHTSIESASSLRKKYRRLLFSVAVLSALMIATASPFLAPLISKRWGGVSDYLAIATLPAAISVLITFESTCLRAFGNLRPVFTGTLIQISTLPVFMIILWHVASVSGVICATFGSATFAWLYMTYKTEKILAT
jgi:O-antigen/teichoic acid export membrane protein